MGWTHGGCHQGLDEALLMQSCLQKDNILRGWSGAGREDSDPQPAQRVSKSEAMQSCQGDRWVDSCRVLLQATQCMGTVTPGRGCRVQSGCHQMRCAASSMGTAGALLQAVSLLPGKAAHGNANSIGDHSDASHHQRKRAEPHLRKRMSDSNCFFWTLASCRMYSGLLNLAILSCSTHKHPFSTCIQQHCLED